MGTKPGTFRKPSVFSPGVSHTVCSMLSSHWRHTISQGCMLFVKQCPSQSQLTKHCIARRVPGSSLITRRLISLLSSPSLPGDYVLDSRLSRRRQSGVYTVSLQVLLRQEFAW